MILVNSCPSHQGKSYSVYSVLKLIIQKNPSATVSPTNYKSSPDERYVSSEPRT